MKGSRPLVKMKDDALVTTVEGSYLSKTGTAGDVLGKIPGVISNHGSVEVIGRGTPLIYINGRQMRNQSELDQLSSDQIKDVEVVMTPGVSQEIFSEKQLSWLMLPDPRPKQRGWGTHHQAPQEHYRSFLLLQSSLLRS